MMFSFGIVNVYFRVFVGGVKCNLLGQDFMTKFECQWNYKQNHMAMKCVHTSEVDEGCLVVSLEDEVIPPKNEAVMKSKMISGAKTKEGVLVPFKMFIHMHGSDLLLRMH